MDQIEQIENRIERLRKRLAKLDAERSVVLKELHDHEAALRVIGALSDSGATPDASPFGRGTKPYPVKLSDATLEAIEASMPAGIKGYAVGQWIADTHGFKPKPNSVMGTLQRHRKNGLIVNREGRWYMAAAEEESEPQGDGAPWELKMVS